MKLKIQIDDEDPASKQLAAYGLLDAYTAP